MTTTLTRSGQAERSLDRMMMTCDLPVLTGPAGAPASVRCRPTGRDRRRVRPFAGAGRAPAVSPRAARIMRRRRRVALAVVTTFAAALTWLAILVGGQLEAAAAQQAPAATQVVHVRSGESLTSLAQRIAPGHSPEAVVAMLRELNGLADSALLPGQALIAPQFG